MPNDGETPVVETTPVAVETTPATPPASEAADDVDAFDFADFAEDLDEVTEEPAVSEGETPQPQTTEPPAAPASPAVPVEPAAQVPQTPPVTPPVAPTEPVTAPAEQSSPEQTPEQTQQQMATFVESASKLLAEKVYNLDEATAKAVDTQKPSQIIPILAGRIHMQVMTAAMNQFANMFPALLDMHTSQRELVQQTEDTFFEKFPQLKAHGETVNRIARAYLQQNPKADQAAAMQEIGTMAMLTLRLPLTQPQPTPAAVPTAPVMPVSAIGASGQQPASQDGSNWLTQLIEEE